MKPMEDKYSIYELNIIMKSIIKNYKAEAVKENITKKYEECETDFEKIVYGKEFTDIQRTINEGVKALICGFYNDTTILDNAGFYENIDAIHYVYIINGLKDLTSMSFKEAITPYKVGSIDYNEVIEKYKNKCENIGKSLFIKYVCTQKNHPQRDYYKLLADKSKKCESAYVSAPIEGILIAKFEESLRKTQEKLASQKDFDTIKTGQEILCKYIGEFGRSISKLCKEKYNDITARGHLQGHIYKGFYGCSNEVIIKKLKEKGIKVVGGSLNKTLDEKNLIYKVATLHMLTHEIDLNGSKFNMDELLLLARKIGYIARERFYETYGKTPLDDILTVRNTDYSQMVELTFDMGDDGEESSQGARIRK